MTVWTTELNNVRLAAGEHNGLGAKARLKRLVELGEGMPLLRGGGMVDEARCPHRELAESPPPFRANLPRIGDSDPTWPELAAVAQAFVRLTVRLPVANSISKWLYRHSSQEVCPWNVSFAREVREPAFAAREVIAHKDLRTLAQDVLAMGEDVFRQAFKGSAMKRAKLTGLQRNARVVLGNAR